MLLFWTQKIGLFPWRRRRRRCLGAEGAQVPARGRRRRPLGRRRRQQGTKQHKCSSRGTTTCVGYWLMGWTVPLWLAPVGYLTCPALPFLLVLEGWVGLWPVIRFGGGMQGKVPQAPKTAKFGRQAGLWSGYRMQNSAKDPGKLWEFASQFTKIFL